MIRWKEVRTLEEWADLLDGSVRRPVLVFKHSTAWPVSANAWLECQACLRDHPLPGVDHALVKVIESRPVSDRIAADLGVKHESPQVILVENRRAVWHVSHGAIRKDTIRKALRVRGPGGEAWPAGLLDVTVP